MNFRHFQLILSLALFSLTGIAKQPQWICGTNPLPQKDADFYQDHPATLLRRTFSISKEKFNSAELSIAGLGTYDLYVNGKRLTETALPIWTPYRHRVLFDTFDLSTILHSGENVIAVQLGNGWYNPLPMRMWGRFNLRNALATGKPCLWAKLLIRDKAGNTQEIVTDAQWETADSPILRNSFYLGETYDANKELKGWKNPGIPSGKWTRAQIAQGPTGKLLKSNVPTVKIHNSWKAKSVREIAPQKYVVDLGVNFGGMARYRLRSLKKGQQIRFRYGELLNPDGSVNVMTAVAGQIKRQGVGGPGAPALAEQCDTLIASDAKKFLYEPRRAFHSFRYIQIEGLDQAPLASDIEALATASAVEDAGTFSCSDPKLNELHEVCRRTFLSNLQSVQSDCPGREKFGYGADIAATAESFFLAFDMGDFYKKTVQDYLDEAQDDGWFTETAPYVGIADHGHGGRSGPIGWTIGVPILLDAIVRYSGDTRFLAHAYPACVRYIDLLRAKFPRHLLPGCIGDHEAIDKAPTHLTATAHYHQWVALTAKFATILNKPDDAKRLNALADEIRSAFQKAYIKDGKVHNGSQGAQIFALYHGLIPVSRQAKAMDNLLAAVHARGDAVSTGIFGTQYLLEYLSQNGQGSLAGKCVTRKTFPGWINMLDHGATTLWENWAGSDNTFSQNHPMFGSVDQWMMRHVLGLQILPDSIGCNKIRIHPQAIAGIIWAKGSYKTPHGKIQISWKLINGKIDLQTKIPEGITVLP